MSIINKVLSASAGSFMDKASSAIKRFVTTDQDRLEFQKEMESLLQQRDAEVEQTIRAELGAKERTLVAELQQGDTYTKRARPTVVYAGLLFIAINHVLFPMVARILTLFAGDALSTEDIAMLTAPIDLPYEFWAAWGGICSVWVLGRSAEKRGARNKLISTITGTKNPSSILD
ncbi:MAG: holin family protein [Neptuniibacter sp.]